MTDEIREQLARALAPQYRLERELGGGGMSRVYVARDETLGRDVVVKVLSPELAQEFSVERFTREIRLAANLQHAHIVPLLSAGATPSGLPYYLMPYVDGESLRARVSAGALPIGETIVVLKDVARALGYAHARGVVHRDIKPDNVLVSHGAAVVTDFGIAKAVTSARAERAAGDDTLTRMGTSLGTPAYMAPEQGAGDPDTDHRADIYAFGAMAYELLAGVTPFGSRAPHALLVAHVAEQPVPVEQRRADVPPALARLVMQCLAKDPADRPQNASELLAALDNATTGSVAPSNAGASAPSTGAGTSAITMGVPGSTTTGGEATGNATGNAGRAERRGLTRGLIAAVVLLALGAGGYGVYRATRRAPEANGSLIAVMPFNARDASLAVWREGLVDVLSRSLDGVGDLRTVAPSLTIAKSPERADVASAKILGDALGARLVLFGDLSPIGRDSVHLRAALFDVANNKTRFDLDVRGAGDRIDALSDSLALGVLRQLGTSGELGGGRLYSVGTRSLPALRAFLRGQQLYRRGVADSARTAYDEAVALDSTFALGWRGVASIYIRTGRESDPAAQRALDNAIRYKRGVSPRDSMLLRADSLRLAFVRRPPQPDDAIANLPQLDTLMHTLREATSRYASDAELWYEYGDALFHFGEFAGYPPSDALAAFRQGIALDSSFIVPYYHSSDLLMRDGRGREAAPYVRKTGELFSAQARQYYRLFAAVLDSPPPFSRASRALRDSVPVQLVSTLIAQLASFPDSAATALGLATLQREQPQPLSTPEDSAAVREAAMGAFASRGRFGDALTAAGPTVSLDPNAVSMLVQLAGLGAYSRDEALAVARQTVQRDPARALSALRLFMEARDTASIQRLETWASQADRSPPTGGNPSTRYGDIARAYLQLARGDSARALAAFLAVPMEACGRIPCAGALVARLLVARGRDADAARILDRWLPNAITTAAWPREQLLRGEIAERMGARAVAATAYRRVIARWRDADATVQPIVAAARAGLARTQ